MRLKTFFTIAIYFVITNYCCFAQTTQYQFSRLDITNGLSNSQVNCIYKDYKGFMWFGTASGLNRYDGLKFKVFKSNSADTTTLSDDFIVSLFEGPEKQLWIRTKNGYNIYDPLTEHFNRSPQKFLKSAGLPDAIITYIKKGRQQGDFWFTFQGLGVYLYNSLTKKVRHYYQNVRAQGAIYSNNVADIAINAKGQAWLMHNDGIFEMLDPVLNRVVFRSDLLKKAKTNSNYYLITVDSDNDVWFYSSVSVGLYFFSSEKNVLSRVDSDTEGKRLKSNIIFNAVQDNKGIIWLATDHGGINLVNKKDFKISYLLNREDDKKSLSQNSIIAIYKDDAGIMWAGTYKKGISYYHQDIIRFPLYRHHASDSKSIGFDDVNRFAEDLKGNLWIGTNGGGLIYFDRTLGTYTSYLHDARNTNSLSSDVIVGLCVDHEQKLWIGTYGGGLDCFDGHTFKHYRHNDDPGSISDNRVWDIIEDSSNRLWVGTLNGGLNYFDRRKQQFEHYYGPQKKKPASSAYVPAICEDADKNLWIAGYSGLNVLQKKTGKFINYIHQNANANSLVNNNVNSIIQDSRKLMWIGTRGGLSIFDVTTNKFLNLKKQNGLPDNAVLDVVEDEQHTMWISTLNGLSNVQIKKGPKGYSLVFKNFNEADGLQGREFNENAAFKTRDGNLIFGGANGFNLFKPTDIHIHKNKISLVFTDLQIFNKSVSVGQDVSKHVILSHSIAESNYLEIPYNENVFSIEFAALDYFNAEKLSCQYMMEGFDKHWLTSDNNRKATYTNLDPGEYTFRVRATNPEVQKSLATIALTIKILPPFWRTIWAYIFYILLFFGVLFSIRYRGIKKIEAKFALEQERQEVQRAREQERQDAQRMHELDLMKIKFLTNVGHELKTPLSLIIAPVDKMISSTELPAQAPQLQIIKRNARRLLNLVNQLLDFRRLEQHELKLYASCGDIVGFIKELTNSFTDIAEKRNIGFVFDSDTDYVETVFDHDKIERILFNLLSNAFKFTQPGGHVSVILSLIVNADKNEGNHLEIKVIDTGIGIPKDKLDKIFERFFQNDLPGFMINQGSGIGLSIVKEFVKMHNGYITVESEVNQGSCFVVRLPLTAKEAIEIDHQPVEQRIVTDQDSKSKNKKQHKKPTILLVEDNDDFRFYLKDNLKELFHVLEAVNGKEGWQKALALHPDLMLSDINMPEMSGTELCVKIKQDPRTSHIPVILLTALSGETELIRGLKTGANDYMNKPFNFEVLVSKIENLLTLQHHFKKTYTKHVDVKLPDMMVQSEDEKFIGNMLEYIEQNIINPNLSVEDVSRKMCMSRVSLYKKVLMITGKSPVEFIRSFRLKKAAQLFEKTQLNIAEVSYEVGFNTPNYFAKSFKAEYDILPSEYLANVRKKALEEQSKV